MPLLLPPEQKNYSQNAVVLHRGFFMSRDIQYSPTILNFQTATTIGLRHDTYLTHTDPSYVACSVQEKFLSTFSMSSNRPFCRRHLEGEEWCLPEFWPLIPKPGIIWVVAQQFVFLPQTCQQHTRSQTINLLKFAIICSQDL